MAEHEEEQGGEPEGRTMDVHMSPEVAAGHYANFGTVTHSPYEFTLSFAAVDHEMEGPVIPGVATARVRMSPLFFKQLLDAMNDNWSKYEYKASIAALPTTEERDPPPAGE